MMSVKPSFHLHKAWVTRWWFETSFFYPSLGMMIPFLTNMFNGVENQQLDNMVVHTSQRDDCHGIFGEDLPVESVEVVA